MPDDGPQKFEPGTANHEGWAGWLGSLRYLRDVLGGGQPGREGLTRAFQRIAQLEQPLLEAALEQLCRHPRVQLYGPKTSAGRVATFCFNVTGLSPRAVAEHLAEQGVGVAAGHYYATMAAEALGLMPDGAVRASLLHYNTAEDVGRLLAALDSLP
nr:aminotransferase class V-fold PLP-dependent enzyme [Corallococcus exiguus]